MKYVSVQNNIIYLLGESQRYDQETGHEEDIYRKRCIRGCYVHSDRINQEACLLPNLVPPGLSKFQILQFYNLISSKFSSFYVLKLPND